MFAGLTFIALTVCLLFCESPEGRLGYAMSIGALLEQKINTGWKVVWVVNNFKGLELKYGSNRDGYCRTMLLNGDRCLSSITLRITLDIFSETH